MAFCIVTKKIKDWININLWDAILITIMISS